jgi:uncharacterized protein
VSASCVYEGRVRHRRHRPVEHSFRYPMFMMYLDLDELPAVLDPYRLWSARGPAPAWFRRTDFFGDPAVPLREAVLDAVAERTAQRPDGPVRLLTHLRYLGHSFNPVSFYYCFDSGGEHVEAVLAEVTNTPWRERHAYVLSRGQSGGAVLSDSLGKDFHVSPFLGMDGRYEWRVSEPGPALSVHIASAEEGAPVFDATLSLERRELSRATLRRLLVRYPAASLAVVARIYLHALALKLKGVPVHRHPERAR